MTIRAGIIGGGGYVAGELIRLLSSHPHVSLDFIYSHSQAGKQVADLHQDLFHSTLEFTDQIQYDADVVFLCLGHGQARAFLGEHRFSEKTRLIDLSHDFRLSAQAQFQELQFVYGLPELHADKIAGARYIANPGCFATAIELALLPLAKAGVLPAEVHVTALTGSTGAGQSLSETSHFSWRNNNISIYKPFSHQHLGEIGESVRALQTAYDGKINFIPVRGDFTRGIFASVYLDSRFSGDEVRSLYEAFYKDAPFTQVTEATVHLKQVVNTNYCLLQTGVYDSKVHITSVIDNLLKGASGQAIQNMNLMFGLDQRTGLHLKANAF